MSDWIYLGGGRRHEVRGSAVAMFSTRQNFLYKIVQIIE